VGNSDKIIRFFCIQHKIIFFDRFSLTMRMLINAEEGTNKANKTMNQVVHEASHLDRMPDFIHPV
jgi:hypothetical protein